MESQTVACGPHGPYGDGHVFEDGTRVQEDDGALYLVREIAPEKLVRIHAGGKAELLCGGTRPVPENIRTVLAGAPPEVTLEGARALLVRLTKDDYEEINAIDLEDSDLEEADSEDSPGSEDEYELDGFVVADDDESVAPETTSTLTDVDQSNILPPGKRRRRSTRTIYDEPEFQEQLSDTLLADVPDDELMAALVDDTADVDAGTNSDEYEDSSCEDDDDDGFESEASEDLACTDDD
jgi:hypothetical protein